jgi:tRNA A-37 threonylcarbamoyl transferase component Bud32
MPAAYVVGRRGVHRRPSGEPPPLPRPPWWRTSLIIVGVTLALGVLLGALYATVSPANTLDVFTDLADGVVGTIAEALNRLTSPLAIIAMRLAMVVVLIAYGRFRHLLVALVAMFAVDVFVEYLSVGLPTPHAAITVEPDDGYAFPAKAIASLSVTLGCMAMSMAPAGRARRRALLGAAAVITLVALADMILSTAYPLAALYAGLLGLAVAVATFGWLAPDAAFPVSYVKGGTGAHLDLAGERTNAVVRAMHDQLGLTVTEVRSFGEEGSGGSTPLLMTLDGGTHVFGKILATSHVSSDRWYRVMRTIMYGRLEDETTFSSVRRLIEAEDYALRLLDDLGFRVAHSYGIVELTPNEEYLLVEEFFEGAETLGHAEVTDQVIDEGIALVRRMWDAGLSHRDIKPANLLVVDGHLQLIDVSGLEVRPSPWRQAVDLANMMLVLALRTDAERVYQRALERFTAEEIAEAFAAAQGMAMPTELQRHLKEDPRDLLAEFRALAPARQPISIQRLSTRRIVLTVAVVGGAILAIVWSIRVLFDV